MKFCPKCGMQVGPETKFCPGCGNPLNPVITPPADPEPETPPTERPVHQMPYGDIPAANEPGEETIRAEKPPKKSGNARLIIIIAAVLAAIAIIFGALVGTHTICLFHDYSEPTCTEPATCSYCGKTSGEALGHDWIAATCTEPRTCARCGETDGQALGHDWQDATCTEPETCADCGLTRGEALGHDFQGGNCTEPAVCTRCGEESEAPGHVWTDATCTEPKTCSVCGETEGDPLGHDYVNGVCTRCGEYDPNNAAIGSYTGFGYMYNGEGTICSSDTNTFTMELTADGVVKYTQQDENYTGTWKQTGEGTYSYTQGGYTYDMEYSDAGIMQLHIVYDSGDKLDVVLTQKNVYSDSGSAPVGHYVCTRCYDESGTDYVIEDETLDLYNGGIGQCYMWEWNILIFWNAKDSNVTVDIDSDSNTDKYSDDVITVKSGDYYFDFTKK